jgi:hypothetical protein
MRTAITLAAWIYTLSIRPPHNILGEICMWVVLIYTFVFAIKEDLKATK